MLCMLTLMLARTAAAQVPQKPDETLEIDPKIPIRAYAFSLKDVRLLDGPFAHACEINAQYLLRLEPDRLLSWFRERAGLQPKDRVYGGWEKATIAGHSLGHYLTACSLTYTQIGDERFKERVDYIVDELQICQKAHGDGYVAAFPRGREIFDEVERGDIRTKGFDLNGCWVPLYTLHKQLAGLIDAYRLCENKKALEVAIGLADYLDSKIGRLTEPQMQKLLNCEHGGINEAVANLYAVTGEPEYLRLAERIYHKQILDPLAESRDELNGKHANTQVPKLIGLTRLYELTGKENYAAAAKFFWKTVTENHTYVNGGNSAWEYFGPPGKLNDRLGDTTETCNTYNMLKLTRHLFTWNPDARYADYYERALYNHILAHQHPETGMFVYKGFLDFGATKNYSTPFDSFWCCVGSGMENHAKYGDSIYFHDDDGLFVNLFISSRLDWAEKGVKITQRTNFPKTETTTLSIRTDKPIRMPIRIRRPYWTTKDFQIKVNGKAVKVSGKPGSFAAVNRRWNNHDTIEAKMPMSIRTESMPDNPDRIAFLYGPIVLCAQVHKNAMPVLVPNTGEVADSVKRVSDDSLEFRTLGIGRPDDVRLIPLYAMHDKSYTVYFDKFTDKQWAARQAAYEAERQRIEEMKARTVDVVRVGEMQPERDHNFRGENTSTGTFNGRRWRHAYNGWFSFDVKVDPQKPVDLIVRYWGSESGARNFDILLDGQKIATQQLKNNKPGEFFYATYPLNPELTAGKEKVTVRFQSHPGNTAGGVFGLRIVRRK